jgi:hypothetical protein
MKDIQKIKEFFSKPLNEGNKEYFKPSIRKDKTNPNFLYVDIAYPEGSDILSVGGSKTMGGQDREEGAAKALSMGNAIVKKLQSKYNIEDIEVKDLKNGKVQVFAVSDDFTKMASPSLDEAKKETAVDMAKKQLDALGVKYELGNEFKPFKVIYKPTGQSDEFYDTFEDIVDLFSLKGVVKSSMGEAKFMSGMISGKDFINAKLKNYPKAVAKVNQLIDMIGESKFTIEMAEWIFDFFNNAHFESPMNEAKISHFKIGDVVELKIIPENLPYEIRKGIIDNKWEIIRVSKSGRSMYSDIMEDVFGYEIELLDKKFKYKMFVYPEDVKSSMNEAKEQSLYKDWDQFEKPSKIKVYLNNGKTLEITPLKLKGGKRAYNAILQAFIDDRLDITNKVIQGMTNNLSEAKSEDKVDTITMDIPLFLRMLEYSREDASQDMDLHDVTEKAISLGKERGILQMDDYNEIIGTTEKINEVNLKQAKLSSAEYQKAKKLKDFKASDWKWNADEDLYTKVVNEAELSEAYVPSNIKEFAKRKGISSLVNKVAGWAEKAGKGIRGGTAIGKDYSTLVLDMTYQGGEIRINTDNDTITLFDEPVNSFNEFQRVYIDGQDLEENVAPNHNGKSSPYGSGYKPLEERISEALDSINEELCPAGKAYRKRRMAAGEKSSAYLSGRAVKVCKGQMSGKKKKK